MFAGAEVFEIAMTTLDPAVKVTLEVADGDAFEAGAVLAHVEGPARAVLQAERVALNLVQRMTGIATLTATYVEAVAGTDARVVDTRKTTPGLRALERHAVRCGGGHNHRYSLSDAVMAKDNHLAVIPDITRRCGRPRPICRTRPTSRSRSTGSTRSTRCSTPARPARSCSTTSASTTCAPASRTIAGRALVEASGGITLDTIADIARTGVDIISVGALTHSVRALDLGLDITVS